jgi:hypothetical protein
MFKFFYIFILLGVAITPAKAEKQVKPAYQSGSIQYTIKVGALQSQRELMSFFVLPAQKLAITVEKQKSPMTFTVTGHKTTSAKVGSFEYIAPTKTGHYDLIIKPSTEDPGSTVRIFVMRPATEVKKGVLNGYRIGEYPKERYKGQAIYDPPTGFIEVTDKNFSLPVSPHYKLGQFLSKQGGKYPKYLVLQTRLLRKLEYVTDLVNAHGIRTDGFHIMSGFRTPYYNAAIKNKLYSRHQWGGAADIFIDENPKDNNMDDLNGDGKINFEDSKYLANLIESRFSAADYQLFIGGLGLYKANSAHGPFVHIDVRGTKARW